MSAPLQPGFIAAGAILLNYVLLTCLLGLISVCSAYSCSQLAPVILHAG